MKRYILYLILGIVAMSVSSCEQVDTELYQNPPSIKAIKYHVSTINASQVRLEVTVFLDKCYGERAFFDFTNEMNPNNVYMFVANGYDGTYKDSYTYKGSCNIYLSKNDIINYNEGRVEIKKLYVNVVSSDEQHQTLSSAYFEDLDYTRKPSIQVTKVEKEKTEYNNSEGKYYTHYKVYYTITGAPFIEETYEYLIGNWKNTGKWATLSRYDGNHSYSTWISYGYSNDSYAYVQYRAKTKAGTELISDKAVCLEGTGRGDQYVYLVNSSSIYSTRSSGNKNSDADGAVAGTCYPIIQEANSQVANVAIPVSNQEE